MRSVRLLTLVLTLASPALHSQELPSSLGAVQGTLLAADTKQPILDASVWLEPATPNTPPSAAPGEPADMAPPGVAESAVKTDPAGRFLVPKVKPGDYYVLFCPRATGETGTSYPPPAHSPLPNPCPPS